MSRSLPTLLLIAVALGACSDGAAAPDSIVIVTDSAGVRITTLPFDGFSAAPVQIASEPRFRVGWEEQGPLLDFVTFGRILNDGTIVVADLGPNQLLFVSPTGEIRQSFGRDGEGPGEFEGVGGIVQLPSDSLAVWDPGQSRLTVLSPTDLGFRTRSYPQAASEEHTIGAATAAGDLLWNPYATRLVGTVESDWFDGSLLRTDRDLEREDTVVWVPLYEMVEIAGRHEMRPIPIRGLAKSVPAGFVWLRNDSPEVHWYDAYSGDLSDIVRWAEAPIPVTDASWKEYVDAEMLRMAGPGGGAPPPPRVRKAMFDDRRALAPEYFPHFSALAVASDESVWIRKWAAFGSEESIYVVISPDRSCMMLLRAPLRFHFMDARDGVILGRDVNELGVHAIAAYDQPTCGEG